MCLENYQNCLLLNKQKQPNVSLKDFLFFMRARIAKHVQKLQKQGFALIKTLLSSVFEIEKRIMDQDQLTVGFCEPLSMV